LAHLSLLRFGAGESSGRLLVLTSCAPVKRMLPLMWYMHIEWLLAGCLRRLFVTGIAFATCLDIASAVPQLSCKSTSYEFGVSDGAASVEHTFVLENSGDETLTFGRVRGCCGASTSLRDKTVAPGTNTTLHVKLSLRGRKGTVTKSIYVASNDPKQPYLRLRLTGSVAGTLDVSRRFVDFGAVSSSASATQTVTVSSAANLSITNIHCTSSHFKADVERVSSNRHSVTVGLVPPLPPGCSLGKVRLLTDSAKTPKVEFYVQVTFSCDIVAVPRELTVIEPNGDPKPVTRYLALRSRNRIPFNITGVQLPEEGMTHKLTAWGNAGWRIEIGEILPLSELDGASITLHTDRDDEPTLSIPLRVVSRKPQTKSGNE
jgi:hypothetical protein